jgi:hypothetical protein
MLASSHHQPMLGTAMCSMRILYNEANLRCLVQAAHVVQPPPRLAQSLLQGRLPLGHLLRGGAVGRRRPRRRRLQFLVLAHSIALPTSDNHQLDVQTSSVLLARRCRCCLSDGGLATKLLTAAGGQRQQSCLQHVAAWPYTSRPYTAHLLCQLHLQRFLPLLQPPHREILVPQRRGLCFKVCQLHRHFGGPGLNFPQPLSRFLQCASGCRDRFVAGEALTAVCRAVRPLRACAALLDYLTRCQAAKALSGPGKTSKSIRNLDVVNSARPGRC